VVLDQAVPTIDGLSAPIDVDSFESSSAVTVIASFAGTEKTFGASPPDLGIAAAPGVLVLSTNDSVSLLKKTGTPVRSTSLAAFFDAVKRPTQNVFDPRVLFDTTSNRFFLSATGFDCTSDPCVSDIVLAVSKSAGPKTLDSADWYFYSFDATLDGATPTAARADFPTFGINGPVVVFAFQMLSRDGAFEKEKIRVSRSQTSLVLPSQGTTDSLASKREPGRCARAAAREHLRGQGRWRQATGQASSSKWG
jgi:hypothetical protein